MSKNLVLTGMMSGKSTVGRELSKVKLKFVDIDKLIEKEKNVNTENFSTKGEKYFRGSIKHA